jgi:hypothetical protein
MLEDLINLLLQLLPHRFQGLLDLLVPNLLLHQQQLGRAFA